MVEVASICHVHQAIMEYTQAFMIEKSVMENIFRSNRKNSARFGVNIIILV
jgi:hypothetical protein